MNLTPEQLRALAVESRELARMADFLADYPVAEFAALRIALSARRIAEAVVPQDLIYKP